MATTIGELVIELRAAGGDAVKAALAGVKQQSEAANVSGMAVSRGLSTAFATGMSAYKPDAPKALIQIESNLAATVAQVTAAYKAQQITGVQANQAIATATATAAQAATRAGTAYAELAAQQRQHQQGLAATASLYSTASGAVMGWVRAGMAGTLEGNYLTFQFQQLSRQIASVFLPVIETVVSRVQQLTQWFRGLSGSQQAAIGGFVTAGVASLALANYLPGVAAGFRLIGAAISAHPIVLAAGALAALLATTQEGRDLFRDLGTAFTDAFREIAPIIAGIARELQPVIQGLAEFLRATLLPIIQGIGTVAGAARGLIGGARAFVQQHTAGVSSFVQQHTEGMPGWVRALLRWSPVGLAGRAVGFDPLAQAEGGTTAAAAAAQRPHRELTPAGTGFEAVEQSFRRLQEAALQTDIPQQQLNVQTDTRDLIRVMVENLLRLAQLRPLVGA